MLQYFSIINQLFIEFMMAIERVHIIMIFSATYYLLRNFSEVFQKMRVNALIKNFENASFFPDRDIGHRVSRVRSL